MSLASRLASNSPSSTTNSMSRPAPNDPGVTTDVLSVSIEGAEERTEASGSRPYTCYRILVTPTSTVTGEPVPSASWTVLRRYKEFEALNKTIKAEHGHLFAANKLAFPKKKLFARAEAVVAQRRAAFNTYLAVLLAEPSTSASPDLATFLDVPAHSSALSVPLSALAPVSPVHKSPDPVTATTSHSPPTTKSRQTGAAAAAAAAAATTTTTSTSSSSPQRHNSPPAADLSAASLDSSATSSTASPPPLPAEEAAPSLESFLKDAANAVRRSNIPKARSILSEAVAAFPSKAEAHAELADLLDKHNLDLTLAEREFATAASLAPRDPTIVHNYARFLSTLPPERAAGAEAAFQKALTLDPRNAESLNAYGAWLAAVRGDLAGAEAQYEKAIAADGNHGPTMANYARLLELKNDTEQAATFYDAAHKLLPNDPDLLNNIAEFERTRAGPLLTTPASSLSAFEAVRAGQVRTRIENLYIEALARNPSHVLALSNYASFLEQVMGDLVSAKRRHQTAVDILNNPDIESRLSAPQRALVLANAGAFHAASSEADALDTASSLFEAALVIHPTSEFALRAYADAVAGKNEPKASELKERLDMMWLSRQQSIPT